MRVCFISFSLAVTKTDDLNSPVRKKKTGGIYSDIWTNFYFLSTKLHQTFQQFIPS